MIYNLYAIRDEKTCFMQPMLDVNDVAAKRNFELTLATAHGESIMGFAPEDFKLYRIGTFDNESGVVSPLTIPDFIASGGSLEV